MQKRNDGNLLEGIWVNIKEKKRNDIAIGIFYKPSNQTEEIQMNFWLIN